MEVNETDFKVGDTVSVRLNTLWNYTKVGEIVAIGLHHALIYHSLDDSESLVELSRLRK
jgi:hypothetical protein